MFLQVIKQVCSTKMMRPYDLFFDLIPHFPQFKKIALPTDGRTDGRTDGHTLL